MIKFFRTFVKVVKRKLKVFDEESGRNYSKNYLLISFMFYRSFQKQLLNDEIIRYQIENVGIPTDTLTQHIIATESIGTSLDTKPPEVLRNNIRNLERLLTFIDNEIEITSRHNYVFDGKTTKVIYLTAILLQIAVYPEKYPQEKYTNKKAIKEALNILELHEDEFYKFGKETEAFQSILNSYRQFKAAFKKKYNFCN